MGGCECEAGKMRVHEELAWAEVRARLLGRRHIVRLGRYVLGERLGEGSYGTVHAAYDPELDRHVAIKIVRSGRSVTDRHTLRHRRFELEARALGSLRHHNVVEVYDFGLARIPDAAEEDEEQIFIVMELVRGRTLRRWLAERPRAWREVMKVFASIADGLSAAHRANIVHRDVKPDNVMMTDDGRVKVLDFGLAHVAQTLPSEAELDTRPDMHLDSTELTRTGDVLGTPRYMAPEQHDGRETSFASDQFAFCVSLWEALYGRTPYDLGSTRSLAEQKRSGRILAPPRGSNVPRAIARVLRRGLRPNPAERFESLAALMRALRRASGFRLGRRVLVAACVGSMAATGAAWSAYAPNEDCSAGPVHAAWDPAQQQRARAGVLDTDVAAASIVWEQVHTTVDAHVQRWTAERRAACDAAGKHGFAWTSPTLDPRCEQRRALAVRTLVDLLAQADRKTLRAAVGMARELDRRADCSTEDASGRETPRVAAVRDQLLEAEMSLGTGAAEAGLLQAATAVVDARAIDDERLLARALYVRGRLERDLGRWRDTEATLEEALWRAQLSGDAMLSAQVVPYLQYTRTRLGKVDLQDMQALLDIQRRAGEPPRPTASMLVVVGHTHLSRREYDRAEEAFERAKKLLVDHDALDALPYAEALTGLSTVQRRRGHPEQAQALVVEAIEHMETMFGPLEPALAYAHERLGAIHHSVGRLDEAAREYQTCIDLFEAIYGPDHPDSAWPRTILGMVWYQRGDLERAAKMVDAGLAILEAREDAPSELLGTALINAALVAHARERHVEARRHLERARVVFVDMGGEHTWDVADIDRRIGQTLAADKRFDEAAAILMRAISLLQDLDRPRDLARVHYELGSVDAARGRVASARRHLRQAIALAEAIDDPPDELGKARALLAEL